MGGSVVVVGGSVVVVGGSVVVVGGSVVVVGGSVVVVFSSSNNVVVPNSKYEICFCSKFQMFKHFIKNNSMKE